MDVLETMLWSFLTPSNLNIQHLIAVENIEKCYAWALFSLFLSAGRSRRYASVAQLLTEEKLFVNSSKRTNPQRPFSLSLFFQFSVRVTSDFYFCFHILSHKSTWSNCTACDPTWVEFNWELSKAKTFLFRVCAAKKLNLTEEEKHTRVYFHFKTFIDFKSKWTGNGYTMCYHTVVSVKVSVWSLLAVTNV